MTCASASECWAVGYTSDATSGFYQTLIERWDGTSWAIVSSPNTSATTDNYLNAVTCVSTSDCWAAGAYNITVSGTPYQTLIERWDGTSWAVVSSPNNNPSDTNCVASGQSPGCTQDNVLVSVACVSASDCWAAGYYIGNNNETLTERWFTDDDAAFPGGETGLVTRTRGLAALRRFVERPYRRIGVSTHGAMVRQLMKHALPPGSPPAKTRNTILYILRYEPIGDRLSILEKENLIVAPK